MKTNKMKNLTQWEHFKENYLKVSIAMASMWISTMTISLIRGDEGWRFSFFYLILAIVILPIGNYFSWKKKYGSK